MKNALKKLDMIGNRSPVLITIKRKNIKINCGVRTSRLKT